MKAIHSMIAAVGLAFVLPTVAGAAAGDPEVIIYRFPGVRDNGGAAAPAWQPAFIARTLVG
jgi:hypothetical protein